MDACVLIDFVKADRFVLELIVKHIGPVYLIEQIVEEVRDIDDKSELVDLGIEIIEPDIEDAFLAAAQDIGPISFQDWLCLLTAKRYGMICVTNDKPLRKYCKEWGVSVLWGLELLIRLHRSGGISGKAAIGIAHTIHANNPRHITSQILETFKARIKQGKVNHD